MSPPISLFLSDLDFPHPLSDLAVAPSWHEEATGQWLLLVARFFFSNYHQRPLSLPRSKTNGDELFGTNGDEFYVVVHDPCRQGQAQGTADITTLHMLNIYTCNNLRTN